MSVFPQFKTNPIVNNSIKLPKLGLVKMKLSRPIPEGFILKQARVIRKASGYFVNLCFQANASGEVLTGLSSNAQLVKTRR